MASYSFEDIIHVCCALPEKKTYGENSNCDDGAIDYVTDNFDSSFHQHCDGLCFSIGADLVGTNDYDSQVKCKDHGCSFAVAIVETPKFSQSDSTAHSLLLEDVQTIEEDDTSCLKMTVVDYDDFTTGEQFLRHDLLEKGCARNVEDSPVLSFESFSMNSSKNRVLTEKHRNSHIGEYRSVHLPDSLRHVQFNADYSSFGYSSVDHCAEGGRFSFDRVLLHVDNTEFKGTKTIFNLQPDYYMSLFQTFESRLNQLHDHYKDSVADCMNYIVLINYIKSKKRSKLSKPYDIKINRCIESIVRFSVSSECMGMDEDKRRFISSMAYVHVSLCDLSHCVYEVFLKCHDNDQIPLYFRNFSNNDLVCDVLNCCVMYLSSVYSRHRHADAMTFCQFRDHLASLIDPTDRIYTMELLSSNCDGIVKLRPFLHNIFNYDNLINIPVSGMQDNLNGYMSSFSVLNQFDVSLLDHQDIKDHCVNVFAVFLNQQSRSIVVDTRDKKRLGSTLFTCIVQLTGLLVS